MSTQGQFGGIYDGSWFGSYGTAAQQVNVSWAQFNSKATDTRVGWAEFNSRAADTRMGWVAFDTRARQQDGRSGYWRLFFTEMQEKALKEYEKLKGITSEPKPETKPVVKAKPKKKSSPVKAVAVSAPPVRRLPQYIRPTAPEIDYSQPIYALSLEVQRLVLSTYPQLLRLETQRVTLQEAANDADNRRRILLLLAA